ncbi:helix-turn-helix domain-containing protein [Acidithiobacillus sp.]|uniref:helix-turn-helix domain-containing protein n=1 Tax=Acidithiobacillus sp. TaxID=1872118 RepID=UPI00356355A9
MVQRRIRQREAASRLGVSIRQIKRLAQRWQVEGPSGLVSVAAGSGPITLFHKPCARRSWIWYAATMRTSGPKSPVEARSRPPLAALFRRRPLPPDPPHDDTPRGHL